MRQTEHDWCYCLAAACPESGQAVGLVMPRLDVPTINLSLRELSGRLAPGVHAVPIWDRAGFHTGKAVEVPANITVIELPPYAPELNPVENLWHYLRGHHRSLRVYRDYEALVDAAVAAWRAVCLVPKLVRSICAAPYVAPRT